MSSVEKYFSMFAILFGCGFIVSLFVFPELRQLKLLLPLSLIGMTINIGLMFVVLRDIFYRQFGDSTTKYIWIAAILIFWPSVLYYLPRHGFKRRDVYQNE